MSGSRKRKKLTIFEDAAGNVTNDGFLRRLQTEYGIGANWDLVRWYDRHGAIKLHGVRRSTGRGSETRTFYPTQDVDAFAEAWRKVQEGAILAEIARSAQIGTRFWMGLDRLDGVPLDTLRTRVEQALEEMGQAVSITVLADPARGRGLEGLRFYDAVTSKELDDEVSMRIRVALVLPVTSILRLPGDLPRPEGRPRSKEEVRQAVAEAIKQSIADLVRLPLEEALRHIGRNNEQVTWNIMRALEGLSIVEGMSGNAEAFIVRIASQEQERR